MASVKGLKADVSSVSPSSERLEELWGVCGFLCRKWRYAIGRILLEYGDEKTRMNWLNEKREEIPCRLRVPIVR